MSFEVTEERFQILADASKTLADSLGRHATDLKASLNLTIPEFMVMLRTAISAMTANSFAAEALDLAEGDASTASRIFDHMITAHATSLKELTGQAIEGMLSNAGPLQ